MLTMDTENVILTTIMDTLQALQELGDDEIKEMGLQEFDPLREVEIQTFEQASLLASSNGLVFRFEDGNEFQLHCVRSKRGE